VLANFMAHSELDSRALQKPLQHPNGLLCSPQAPRGELAHFLQKPGACRVRKGGGRSISFILFLHLSYL
jgi:hypothetical protein